MANGSWPELLITDWMHFCKVASATCGMQRTDYVFRGHEDSTWDVEPTLARVAKHRGLSEAQARDLEQKATSYFVAHAAELVDPRTVNLSNCSVVAKWMVMQQFGVPTRLLDWTGSPYVAAYFACRGNPNADAAIYLLQRTRCIAQFEALRKSWSGNEHQTQWFDCGGDGLAFIMGTRRFHRAAVQQSSFSVGQSPLIDHGRLIADAAFDEARDEVLWRKIIVPANLKPQFIRQLHAMNVTGASLFPGLDGLGRCIADSMYSDTLMR